MIIKPKIRGFICTTAHPVGCAQNIKEQIAYVENQTPVISGPKKVLVIGSSTGYGLATRITAAFGGSKAATIGVFFEKESDGRRTASAGWYNSVAFENEARAVGLYAKSFNGDAYSDEMKEKVIDAIKNDLGEVDLVVYSLAAPRRTNPKTGMISKSILRPIGKTYTNTSIDLSKNILETVTLPEATQEEIDQTVDVMGGEDWKFWIDALEEAGVLAKGIITVAYSYVGPEVTQGVYRNGTIGKAKDHLEGTAKELDKRLSSFEGRAFISVNKALVTQSSSAIPFIPLYFLILKKVLVEKNIEEDCIAQISRLFLTRLYSPEGVLLDENEFIRMDDHEMKVDVQTAVQGAWDSLTDESLTKVGDVKGYHQDFLKLFGFGIEGVDYDADVDPSMKFPQ